MNISAQDVINVMFNPDDTVNLRVFDDRKEGIFTGAKLSVEAGKFFAVESTLREHNKKNHGIFFVVNSGGQTDDSITRINAQFVEMDDKTFEKQQALIDAFPLPPSMVIRTRKSLHTYWFVKDAKVAKFRPIQKALVSYFGGDPACVNESRVMRLPGFYHCKKEPVLVECISFHPERRYTQEQLAEILNVTEKADVSETEEKTVSDGTEMGLKLIEAQCNFIQHCRDNAAILSEHDWYAMITNLVPFQGGIAKVHALSKDYPAYTKQETDNKISHFQKSGTGPMTCKIIAEKGYQCPKLKSGECTCKSPASLAYLPPSLDGIKILADTLEVSISEMDNLQTVRHFIGEYLFSLDVISANAVISHLLKEKFHFKQADVKPLLQYHREIYRKFEAAKRSKEHRRSSAQIPSWYEATERGLKFLPDILAADMAKNTARNNKPLPPHPQQSRHCRAILSL